MGKESVATTPDSEKANRGFVEAVDALQALRDLSRAAASPSIVPSGNEQVAASTYNAQPRDGGSRGV